ncbi:uncharacterized protein [Antedon mediterranea]|uniref:uncharacterized protein n=1 Tax=Antedon mediterranea TaxID=105859 RepID=UPI003AF41283
MVVSSRIVVIIMIMFNIILVNCQRTCDSQRNVELTPAQRQKLLNIAEVLELLPCEQREKCVFEMQEPPIHLTDTQLNALADRFNGSFENPYDVGTCQESTMQSSSVSVAYEETVSFPSLSFGGKPLRRKRREITPTAQPGTSVCRVNRDDNKMLFLSYNKRGDLVYIAQPSIRNGFVKKQLFYESTCSSNVCESGLACGCSTKLVPAAKAVVYVIKRGEQSSFVESPVMTRTCVAVV